MTCHPEIVPRGFAKDGCIGRPAAVTLDAELDEILLTLILIRDATSQKIARKRLRLPGDVLLEIARCRVAEHGAEAEQQKERNAQQPTSRHSRPARKDHPLPTS